MLEFIESVCARVPHHVIGNKVTYWTQIFSINL